MLTSDQIRAAMASQMQWQTPSGATSVPGYDFAQAPAPVVAPPRPAFGPMMAAMPQGYAEMFARPPQSVQAPSYGSPPVSQSETRGEQSAIRQALLRVISDGSAQTAAPQAGASQPAPRSIVAARPDYPSPNNANPARVVAPVPRQRPVAATTYIIRKGDTLTAIAKRKGTTVQDLLDKNPQIKNANRIVAGAVIQL